MEKKSQNTYFNITKQLLIKLFPNTPILNKTKSYQVDLGQTGKIFFLKKLLKNILIIKTKYKTVLLRTNSF